MHCSDEYDRYAIANGCIFLATKSMEDPRKLRDVVNIAHSVQHNTDQVLDANQVSYTLRQQIYKYGRRIGH